MSQFQRHGPDRLQKYFLYLIVGDWLLLGGVALVLDSLTFVYGCIIALLVVAYNILLIKLCFFRARRASDGYLLYPVVFAALLSFAILGYVFLFQ
ncbi:hypothetical protein [Ferrimonas balearica]|uniref:hypothetical protein n=1 Tax=Ferrimonas balearica TaxID=44012 RepID=UPI001C991F2E|nr:hypothetical protein [Ferrimonas balearica]MBY5920039.1 hypothetical protein [Ferrimonas balearica]MBY5997276.1 hypothetical protein [Ferrimonas balearica]